MNRHCGEQQAVVAQTRNEPSGGRQEGYSSLIMTRILIAVPALNEEASINGVVGEIKRQFPHMDVLVVDDGSTDNTRYCAIEAGANVLSLPFNVGVGGAMRSAFLYAERHEYEVVVQVDGDGQHDILSITKLVEGVMQADVVIGSRFTGETTYVVRGPRRWAMRLLAATLSGVTGTKLTDVTSGFRASGPRAIQLFARDYPVEYLGDTVDSIVLAHRAGLVIEEVPVLMHGRLTGEASQGFVKSTLYLFRSVLAIVVSLSRGKHAGEAS